MCGSWKTGAALFILADQAGGQEGKGSLQAGQVDEEVVGRSAGALGLGANVGQLLPLRIDIDHFDLVNDPVARRQQPATRG